MGLQFRNGLLNERGGTARTCFLVLSTMLWGSIVNAHIAAWHPAMYCLGGTSGTDDQNNNDAVNPLYQLKREDWWFHHVNRCDEFPPAPGVFLELPARGEFTVDLAMSRAYSTLSYGGQFVGDFPDGQPHVGLGITPAGQVPQCITEPNLHAQNESMAAGTVFAISYVSELRDVTPENLVVFTALYNTPWKRIATYSVPDLPKCPSGGCMCAWGWVPNGCGEANMYMEGFRCNVTGATSNTPVSRARAPVWCEDDQSNCVKGAKQMVYWNQLEGNNVVVNGFDLSGNPKSPGYNMKMGFENGAQTDIFERNAVNSEIPRRDSDSAALHLSFPIWAAFVTASLLLVFV